MVLYPARAQPACQGTFVAYWHSSSTTLGERVDSNDTKGESARPRFGDRFLCQTPPMRALL
jgi:hypothetical protein